MAKGFLNRELLPLAGISGKGRFNLSAHPAGRGAVVEEAAAAVREEAIAGGSYTPKVDASSLW
jgi:hypothetical protein